MVYEIIYELNLGLESNYDMVDKIKSLGEWQHVTDSVWFIKSDLSLEEIKERLYSSIMFHPKCERLMIIELYDVHYKGWLPKVFWKWLKKSINL